MGKQGATEAGRKSGGCFGRKILRGYGTNQSNHSQEYQDPASLQNIFPVPIPDSHIYDACHHQRHQKLKQRFQELKQGAQNTFFLILFQIGQQLFHMCFLPFHNMPFPWCASERLGSTFSAACTDPAWSHSLSYKDLASVASFFPEGKAQRSFL